MSGSIPPNLIASLVFGVGQIVVGGGLAWFELAPRKWRDWRAILAGAAGIWFFVSGVCELIVSGMEVSRIAGGGPSLATYTVARGAADETLLAVTVALGVGLAVCGVGRALRSRRASHPAESERGQ